MRVHIYISFQSTCVYLIDFKNTDILCIPKFNIHGNYCLSMHKSHTSFQNEITYQVVISFWYIIQKL